MRYPAFTSKTKAWFANHEPSSAARSARVLEPSGTENLTVPATIGSTTTISFALSKTHAFKKKAENSFFMKLV
jgi:hypothetical protein